jgi:hypothetical protein
MPTCIMLFVPVDWRHERNRLPMVALHVPQEALVGESPALVKDGDTITLDVKARQLDLLADDAELLTSPSMEALSDAQTARSCPVHLCNRRDAASRGTTGPIRGRDDCHSRHVGLHVGPHRRQAQA